MPRNVGTLDRILRVIGAVVLLYLAFGTTLAGDGGLKWIAALAGVVLGVTALAGTCPAYTLLGIRTCRAGK